MRTSASILALGCLLLAASPRPAPAGQPEGRPGSAAAPKKLDTETWQEAEGLLPPEILRHYRNGEYANPLIEWSEDFYRPAAEFERKTQENRGAFSVDDIGTIVERATGRQPGYVVGLPFPDIDPADPQAAVKILWNYYYQYWYAGNTHTAAVVEWLNRTRLERRVLQDVLYLYYDGQPERLAPASNPNNLLLQFMSNTLEPTDLFGTTALSWRSRDATKRDLLWAYVPALRRVRQVSPSNRSDGFLGSDMSQDDGPFFDGKPQEFTWKLVGETTMLRMLDHFVRDDLSFHALAQGGWHLRWKQKARAGHESPDWKGVAWAPVRQGLVKRRVWVIQGTPKDSYYLYGRVELVIDKQTFEGSWNRKFDWKGDLAISFLTTRGVTVSPDGESRFTAPAVVTLAENLRMDRVTMAGAPLTGDPVYDYRVPLDPASFDSQELVRVGK